MAGHWLIGLLQHIRLLGGAEHVGGKRPLAELEQQRRCGRRPRRGARRGAGRGSHAAALMTRAAAACCDGSCSRCAAVDVKRCAGAQRREHRSRRMHPPSRRVRTRPRRGVANRARSAASSWRRRREADRRGCGTDPDTAAAGASAQGLSGATHCGGGAGKGHGEAHRAHAAARAAPARPARRLAHVQSARLRGLHMGEGGGPRSVSSPARPWRAIPTARRHGRGRVEGGVGGVRLDALGSRRAAC